MTVIWQDEWRPALTGWPPFVIPYHKRSRKSFQIGLNQSKNYPYPTNFDLKILERFLTVVRPRYEKDIHERLFYSHLFVVVEYIEHWSIARRHHSSFPSIVRVLSIQNLFMYEKYIIFALLPSPTPIHCSDSIQHYSQKRDEATLLTHRCYM